MPSPYDPTTPLYQGQALTQQVQEVSAPPAVHFFEAAGHALLAGVRFFSGGDDDAEGQEQEERNPRRRPRPRAARVGTGSCCRAKRPAPTKP